MANGPPSAFLAAALDDVGTAGAHYVSDVCVGVVLAWMAPESKGSMP